MVWDENGAITAVKDPNGKWTLGVDPTNDFLNQAKEEGILKIPFPELIDEMKYYANNLMVEKTPAYLGIDPGKSGGLTVMQDGKIVFKAIMPISGDNLDIRGLYDLIRSLTSNYNLTVVLEEVHSIFGSSAGSNFTFGFVCGAIEAIVVSHRLKLIKVQPKKWQKEVWTNSDMAYKPKKPAQKNASVDTKATSLNCAKRLFPDFDFRKSDSARVTKDHDGIVDAVLMCEYARIKNL